jgi:hypothetical protein
MSKLQVQGLPYLNKGLNLKTEKVKVQELLLKVNGSIDFEFI